MNTEITTKQRTEFVEFWSKQREKIETSASEELLEFFDIFTTPINVGFDQGQLRPGELGQWDLFYALNYSGFSREDSLLASGLDAQEFHREEVRDRIIAFGIDPDVIEEREEWERIQSLNEEDLDNEIAETERQLLFGRTGGAATVIALTRGM